MNEEKCPNCGETLTIGSWPFCGDHGKPTASKGFEAFYHIGIGREVTGVGDINQAMRPHWDGDKYIHLQHRDKPDVYYRELNERRAERKEQHRKEREGASR